MRVVVVTGIWPPDVGGPASHAPALADALLAAGHTVRVVTTADAAPVPRPFPVAWVSRGLPAILRYVAVARAVATAAHRADLVYATSMVRRAALGARLARRPLVVKLVSDEAYEREARAGRFDGTLEEFQHTPGGIRARLLRATRTAALRRAERIVVPSVYLETIAIGWGVSPDRLTVVPNPAPSPSSLPSREQARRELGIDGFTLGAAGRLTRQKALGDALAALARVEGARLVLLGDGPERDALEQRTHELGLLERVRFLGARPREDVLTLFRAVDAAILTSHWENLPHTLLEALAVGTPVIATSVGGVPEVLRDGVNGLLVPPGDVGALSGAIERIADDGFRRSLADGAAGSVEELTEPRILERIVRLIEDGGR